MKRFSTIFLLISVIAALQAQTVDNQSLDWKMTKVRPYISFSTPLAKEKDIILPMGLGVEGLYQLGSIADLRASAQIGSFKVISVGGSLRFIDKVYRDKPTRFMVAQTSRKIYFYNGRADYRYIFGPTANLQVGSYSKTGFYGRLDGGLDFRWMGRSYYDTYPSAKNGFYSLKLQATVAKLNQFEYGATDELHSRIGIGGVASFGGEWKPWERWTIFADMEMGYLSILGVKDYDKYGNGIAMENPKSTFLTGAKFGITIRL